ncbi:hypothetical protein KAH55_13335, partial [bacterium]|nr:hypothetical protein [bacterium]
MRRCCVLILFLMLLLTRSGAAAQFDSLAFNQLVEQALLRNTQGDTALQQSALDSALVHYAEARY